MSGEKAGNVNEVIGVETSVKTNLNNTNQIYKSATAGRLNN